jgi:hypothetical protein
MTSGSICTNPAVKTLNKRLTQLFVPVSSGGSHGFSWISAEHGICGISARLPASNATEANSEWALVYLPN